MVRGPARVLSSAGPRSRYTRVVPSSTMAAMGQIICCVSGCTNPISDGYDPALYRWPPEHPFCDDHLAFLATAPGGFVFPLPLKD